MIKAQSLSLSRLSTSLLIGLAAILCNGCTTDGIRQQAAYDRKIQRTGREMSLDISVEFRDDAFGRIASG
jgi:hypothetical protein